MSTPIVETEVREETHVVVFTLANECFGVDVARVQDIRRLPEITHVPRALPFIEGVMNLRGAVIPVADLCQRCGFPSSNRTRASRVVILDLAGQTIGVIVDSVSEVLRVPGDAIEPPSAVVTPEGDGFVRGVARLGDRLVMLLDLDRISNVEL